jgi:pimeloyl-ACP methyl ester carboxylesterase
MKQTIDFLLLTILIFSFGCKDRSYNYPVSPASATANSSIIVSKPFKIGSKKYEADYGTVTVPENRSKSNSHLINIPFLRIHSNSKNPVEPIFGFAGGPGASNMKWDWGKALTFLSEHDFVLVGYRGVDGSIVLDCPEVTEAFKSSNDLLSEETMKTIGNAWSESAKRLSAQEIDLDGYSMLQCIEDNEAVRKALKYKRIDLLSESYGTRVAYLYGLKYPEYIFRSALISVNPPGHFVWKSQMIDLQLKHYAALWSKDTILVQKSPNLYSTLRTVLNAMPDKWLFFSINPGKVKVVTFALLFHRKTAAMVFNAYIAAEQGDPSGLALMSLAYDYVVPSMSIWGDLASKAISADFDSTLNYCTDMDPSDMPLGSPLNKLLWCPLSFGTWPMEQLPEELRNLKQSDVETLLLSGSVDFSTPAEFATNELLPYLKNGRQVILSECGHVNDIWYAKMENTRLILTSFYDTGVVNTEMNSYIPMDFSVKLGFPTIAKIVLCVIALVGIALVTVIICLIKRYRKQKAFLKTTYGYQIK